MGDIAERVAGRVVLFGKRIGDVNGLILISYIIESRSDVYLRIIKTSHLSQIVDYFILIRPRKTGRIVLRSLLKILRRVF
jgi:hypothetical protein